MPSFSLVLGLASVLMLHPGCDGQTVVERQYFGSRGSAQPASVTETQPEEKDQVRSRLQQEQQNFLTFVQQQGLLRQQVQSAPVYPFNDATPRANPEYQLAQLQYQQQILQQQQKVLQLQLQQQRLQQQQQQQQQLSDKPATLAQPEQYQQQLQKTPAPLLGVAFSPATSVAHTRFFGNGINYQYR